MNRIAINDLAAIRTLHASELSAVTGGLLGNLWNRFRLVHRYLPPWVKVTLNPQPLPPRYLRGMLN